MMNHSSTLSTRPSAMEPGGGLTFITSNAVDLFGSEKPVDFAARRDTFGLLLGKPKSNACESATTVESFMCHMDLFSAYKTREWPIFGDFVTAQILNSRNSFLTILSPILETPEINFTVSRTIISAMPFTEIAPCGIPEEPSGSYTYSWKQGVRQYEQGCTIERDLVLDPNFGEKFWLQALASFVTNARLTIDMGIITTLVQTGYENMVRGVTEGGPIDTNKHFIRVAESFLLGAVDPELLIDFVRQQEGPIPGLDTLLVLAGKSEWLRGVQGDSMTMLVQKLSQDPVSAEVMVDFIEGPDSFKSVKIGNRYINIIEFYPFFLGDTEPIRINPLLTRLVIGQFYPPNPYLKPETCFNAKFMCGEATDINLFRQTKKIGMEVAISLKTRLENSLYWDKATGKVSETALAFFRDQTKRRRLASTVPWSWNQENRAYDQMADVNHDLASNSEPDMEEVGCKLKLTDMHFRSEFAGALYDPQTGEFVKPERWGDFHLSAIPNAWIGMDAKLLAEHFQKETGMSAEEGIVQIKRLGKALKSAVWSDDFFFAYMDKNIPKMIGIDRPATATTPATFSIQTVRTPLHREEKNSNKNAADRCKFPDAEIVEEAKGNRFGVWDLPDRPTSMTQLFPPGQASGAGILNLAQEALKEGSSLWAPGGKEAMESVTFAERLLKFLKERVGKTDLTNTRLSPPWQHRPSEVAALIDSIIGTAGPVHIGLPDEINYVADGPIFGATRKVDIAPSSLLGDTVEATRLILQNAVAKNEPRIVINNTTRALACLYNPVYQKMRDIDSLIDTLGGDDVFRAEEIKILHQLYDYAIDLCMNSGSEGDLIDAVRISSILMDSFYDTIAAYSTAIALVPEDAAKTTYRNTTILKGMRSFAANFSNQKTMASFLNKEKAAREKRNGPECIDYGRGFIEALKAYEKPVGPNGRSVTIGRGLGGRPATAVAPVYNADYTQAPAKWVRAPITSSLALRDYLRDKEVAWILPSDSSSFYAYPEDPRLVTSNDAVCTNPHRNKLDLCSLSRSRIFQCRLSAQKGNKGFSAPNRDNNDLFASLRSVKSKSKMGLQSSKNQQPLNMGQFLSMGAFRNDNDDACDMEDPSYNANRIFKSNKTFGVSQNGEVELNSAMAEEYRGPWKARLRYVKNEIHSDAEKFFFRAIIEAKNRLETPVKLSAIGGVLLDVMIIRPFIELRTSAAIAMKAGRETMITTIGHSHVQVTKESRGCWHINVGFFMGLIKINTDNVVLIPNAFPESYIGGKDTTFMTNFKNLSLPNPAKESMIGILLSPDERDFDGPIHITNADTIFRPDIDYAYHLRKHSGGVWMEFILGPNTVKNIDIANMNRETYATCLRAANILSQGPAAYYDPRSGQKEDIEGNGPMGGFNMNMPGVQDVYEGRAKRFPQRLQRYTYVNK